MPPSNDGDCKGDENFLLENSDININGLRANEAKISNIKYAFKYLLPKIPTKITAKIPAKV